MFTRNEGIYFRMFARTGSRTRSLLIFLLCYSTELCLMNISSCLVAMSCGNRKFKQLRDLLSMSWVCSILNTIFLPFRVYQAFFAPSSTARHTLLLEKSIMPHFHSGSLQEHFNEKPKKKVQRRQDSNPKSLAHECCKRFQAETLSKSFVETKSNFHFSIS